MIIKIRHGRNSWKLFDNVADVEYDESVTRISAESHIPDEHDIDGKLVLVGFSVEDIRENVIEVCRIDFLREEVKYIVLFNTIAYLCNDSGTTVDRVVANR